MNRTILHSVGIAMCLLASTLIGPANWVYAQRPQPALVDPLRQGEELVTLEIRPGVTVRIVVASPEGSPRGVFLLFPGGNGRLIAKDGRVIRGGFGRASLPHFAKHGFVAIALDVPSDQADGFGENSRVSDVRVQDVRKVIDFATGKWGRPLFLLGHSSGTFSVAHLAASRADPRIGAIVLAASPTTRGRPGSGMWNVPDFPLRAISVPVLIVHHRDDACRPTSFHEAARLPRLFTASPRVAFLEVRGGETLASDPCAGSWTPHDFFGKESEVVAAIADWALGGQIPERLGP
jgi:pimeloyl-ACP methyl ester carboxylesterase